MGTRERVRDRGPDTAAGGLGPLSTLGHASPVWLTNERLIAVQGTGRTSYHQEWNLADVGRFGWDHGSFEVELRGGGKLTLSPGAATELVGEWSDGQRAEVRWRPGEFRAFYDALAVGAGAHGAAELPPREWRITAPPLAQG